VTFPYVPGLLTFREAPLALRAFEQLNNTPDLVIVDGQGVAHPRRMGIAAHLGLFLEVPTIGCAKSRLIGEHDEPAQAAGSHTPLTDEGDVIGEVVRTQAGTRPLYVSVGHRISLGRAVQMVMACCKRYRLPEPSRLAHQAAGGTLRRVPFSLEGRRSGRGCSQWTATLPRLYGECAQPGTGREVGRWGRVKSQIRIPGIGTNDK
jgi:deoxyribonuclease V